MKKDILDRFNERIFKKDNTPENNDKAIIYFLYNKNTRKTTGITVKGIKDTASDSFLRSIADMVSGSPINFSSNNLNKTGIFKADFVRNDDGDLYFKNIKETRWQEVL